MESIATFFLTFFISGEPLIDNNNNKVITIITNVIVIVIVEAKDIAMALKTDENSPKWDNIKVRVMEYILHAKWNCCERFRQTLMSTAGMTVAEATQDMFWGVGAAPNLVQQTKPDKFIGENQLGKVLHRIRTQVEQLTAINNSSHDCIVLDMPAPPSELLCTIDTSSSPPSSPVKVTRVHVPPPPPLTQATTSLTPEITSLSSVVLPLIDSEPTETGNDNCVLPGDTITNSLLLNSTSVSTSSSRTSSPAPPPRPKRRTIKKRDQKSTVDRYSRRDSSVSSEKRKVSSGSDITSPSSHHVAKTTRTDRGEAIS